MTVCQGQGSPHRTVVTPFELESDGATTCAGDGKPLLHLVCKAGNESCGVGLLFETDTVVDLCADALATAGHLHLESHGPSSMRHSSNCLTSSE
jgi:hypothetical protein